MRARIRFDSRHTHVDGSLAHLVEPVEHPRGLRVATLDEWALAVFGSQEAAQDARTRVNFAWMELLKFERDWIPRPGLVDQLDHAHRSALDPLRCRCAPLVLGVDWGSGPDVTMVDGLPVLTHESPAVCAWVVRDRTTNRYVTCGRTDEHDHISIGGHYMRRGRTEIERDEPTERGGLPLDEGVVAVDQPDGAA